MTKRDISNSDLAGLERAHRQRTEERRLSQLDSEEAEMPCSAAESFFLSWGSISALLLVVLIAVAFATWG